MYKCFPINSKTVCIFAATVWNFSHILGNCRATVSKLLPYAFANNKDH